MTERSSDQVMISEIWFRSNLVNTLFLAYSLLISQLFDQTLLP